MENQFFFHVGYCILNQKIQQMGFCELFNVITHSNQICILGAPLYFYYYCNTRQNLKNTTRSSILTQALSHAAPPLWWHFNRFFIRSVVNPCYSKTKWPPIATSRLSRGFHPHQSHLQDFIPKAASVTVLQALQRFNLQEQEQSVQLLHHLTGHWPMRHLRS